MVMSGSKRNSYDNQSIVPESDVDRQTNSKQRNTGGKNETCFSDHTPDDASPQMSKRSQDNLSASTSDLYGANEVDDYSTSSDGGTVRNINSSVSSDQGDKSSRLSDTKPNVHLTTPSKFVDSSDIPVPCTNSSPIPKDEFPDKTSDNQFGVDVTNISPGAISQESTLFPDNLSRSSESGKSVDCTAAAVKLLDNKSEVIKSDKSIKSAEKKEKKKSWYNMLNPSYKSKSDDFRRLFKDLPDTERLIVDYSCALQKDILVQGRLYVSQNYICFYANIFRWETFVLIKCRDVTSMTKEKTARVIPNAIQVTTEAEKHFFTSFGARDKTFLMLFRIWQNALLEQPMSSQELWQWVHYSYGDELGLTSDDDDYVAPPNVEGDFKCSRSNELSKASDKGFDRSEALNIVEAAAEILADADADHFSSESLLGLGDCEHLILDGVSEEPILTEDHDGFLDQKISENPTDMSDTTDSEGNVEDAEVKCPCTIHEGKELLNTIFPMSVDQVFSLVFTGSKFYYDLLASRKTYDIMDTPWQLCPEIGVKMRQITYTVTLNHSMAKSTHSTETQRLLKHSKPGLLYTIDCDVVNAGIPYCDTFMVKSVYCLTKVSKRECRLRLFGCVHYKKKPMWGLVTSLIEKSAMQGLADFATDLEAALNKEAECSSQQSSSKKLRRRKRMKIDQSKCDNIKDTPRILQRQPTLRKIGQTLSGFDLARIGSNPDLIIVIILATLLVLLLLNMLLFYKLWSLEDQAPKPMPSPAWEFPLDSLSALEREDILQLLKRQDSLHRAETEKWRDALSEIMKLLHLVENSMSDLKSSIDTYSSNSVLKTASSQSPFYPEDTSTSSSTNSFMNPQSTAS